MKMIYDFINPEAIPADLDPGEYTTRVIETGWKDGDFWVLLEYLGQSNNDSNRCLFPLVKHATGWQPTYSDTYVDDITDYHVWDEYKNLVDEPPLLTSGGVVLTDELIEELADEAEKGYDISKLTGIDQ